MTRDFPSPVDHGGMAERPKAVVLKTTERKLRGFESLSLRQFDMQYRIYCLRFQYNLLKLYLLFVLPNIE